jgi:phage terminase large subunit
MAMSSSFLSTDLEDYEGFPIPEEAEEEAREIALQFRVPRVFVPLLEPSRYKGAYGGRAAAKSHFFAEQLIKKAILQPGLRWVCVREIQNSLEQSVKRLLEDKITFYKLDGMFRILNSHIETPGGGIIIFKGMQAYNSDNIKSLEGYDGAWVEEAQTLSDRSLTLLRPTIRKEGSEIWFSWNPRHATDAVDAFFRGETSAPNAILVECSYLDNPWLPDHIVREIEWDRERNPDKHSHVWRGGYEKVSHARVFHDWSVEAFPPADAGTPRLLGCDWGFATSPTVAFDGFFSRALRTIFIENEVYEVGCEIEDTPDLFDGLYCEGACPRPRRTCGRSTHKEARKHTMRGDSARPETISHMQRHGYNKIVPAKKGPNSVEEGVKFLQSYHIKIHPRCRHAVDEFTFYCYPIDQMTGLIIPELPKKKNHIIDSLRYATEPIRQSLQKAGLVF